MEDLYRSRETLREILNKFGMVGETLSWVDEYRENVAKILSRYLKEGKYNGK